MADISQSKVTPIQPVLEKPIASYPTPEIHDTIEREIIDSHGKPYSPLPYGTKYNSVDHGTPPKNLPDHELVYQGPADVSGRLVQRIWVNPRADAKEYNYSTKFVDEDPDYPTIVRTNVVKRDEWVPKEPLAPDPVNSDCLLISQEMMNQTDPPEINSLYVTVVEVYERIPGPIVTTADFDTELNIMVYTNRQSILASDTANPSANPLILELRESPRTKYTKQRITSYLLTLPESKVEYKDGRYPFPTLLFDIDTTVVELTTGRSEVQIEYDDRAAPTAPAKFRVTTSFSTTPPPEVTVYVLGIRDISFRGISYQLGINNVLSDEITTEVQFTADERYGDLEEGKTFSATTPSATEYQNDVIGTYQIVGATIDRWRGSIWTRVLTECYMI